MIQITELLTGDTASRQQVNLKHSTIDTYQMTRGVNLSLERFSLGDEPASFGGTLFVKLTVLRIELARCLIKLSLIAFCHELSFRCNLRQREGLEARVRSSNGATNGGLRPGRGQLVLGGCRVLQRRAEFMPKF